MDPQSNGSALKIQFQIVNDEENQNIVFKVSCTITSDGMKFVRLWNAINLNIREDRQLIN